MNDWIKNSGYNIFEDKDRVDVMLEDGTVLNNRKACKLRWTLGNSDRDIAKWRMYQEPFKGLETAYDGPYPSPLVGEFKYPANNFKPTEIDNKRPINSRVAEAYNTMCGGNLDSNDIEVILTIVKLMENYK